MNTSDDQQPTGPDEEPTTLHYERADPSKEPAHPAGQQAAVEGMLTAGGYLPADRPATADHNRRRAAQHLSAEPPAEKLRRQMLAIMEEYERKTIAARALAGDPNPTDADPLEYVKDIAAAYSADAADALDDYLDRLADKLTLDDVRALRLAGEAAQAVTPRVVKAEADRGKKVPRIADEIGLTESRIYQILREQRDQ
ncbi:MULTISPECIES: hypothetical protein [Streptomyces]|uniref:hypothetical protein n=1 Tax=Streptomyces TaxID=1883 RepID=UPI0005262BBD|nr:MULTISPECIES: hypothetical protein [Streptomyces]